MPRKKKEATVPEEQERLPVAPEEAKSREQTGTKEEVSTGLPPAAALPTPEERRAAALAHGGIVLNLFTGIGGPLLALVIWLLYDRESEYVGWHALQALSFQVVSILLTLLFGGIAGLLWLVTVPLLFVYLGFCLLPFALGFSLITVAVILGSLVYGCAGALTVLDGREFSYRWVSGWIPPLGRAQ